MTVIFFGSTDSSVILLEALLKVKDISIVAVVTKKEKPSGRGQKVSENPVTKFVKERLFFSAKDTISDRLYRPFHFFAIEKVRKIENELRDLKSTLFFVVDFGKIIPQSILDIPEKGTINFHPSLLPCYRGSSPIQNAILNGERETGFSYMLLDAEMDHGPILYQESVAIEADDTSETLEKRLFTQGVLTLEHVITEYLNGNLKPREQDHTSVTVTKLITKEDGLIDFSKEDAETIARKVRAYQPWPGAYFFLSNGKRVQILKAQVTLLPIPPKKEENGLFFTRAKSLLVCCSPNAFLELALVKPEGKQAMGGYDFWLGYGKLFSKKDG